MRISDWSSDVCSSDLRAGRRAQGGAVMLNRQGRPTTPNQQAESDAAGTITGNRGLLMEEALSFEQGAAGRTGVDLPDAPQVTDRPGGLKRQGRSAERRVGKEGERTCRSRWTRNNREK